MSASMALQNTHIHATVAPGLIYFIHLKKTCQDLLIPKQEMWLKKQYF